LGAAEKAASEKLAAAEQARAELETRLAAESARFGAAEKAASEKLAAAEQAAEEKIGAAQREARVTADKLAASERNVAEAQQRLGRLEELLIAADKARVEMAAEIDVLKSRVPATGGGSLTPERARADAAKAGEAFLAAEQRARKERSDEAKAAVASAGATLRQAQFDVAVATDAQGVYRLRAEDTLGIVAGRFYGAGKRWPVVYEANRHVLADPDALVPGITLVVP
jgi:nucleoid-associated protein YgaU